MPTSPWILDVSEADFAEAVLERSKGIPVVLDFWAEWCQPCRMLGPALESLAEEYAGQFMLAKVDVDQNPGLAQRFNVNGIPMVVAVVDGQMAGHFVGVLPEPEIRRFLNAICPSESDKLARQAAEVEASDPARARELYEQAIGLEPKNAIATAGLAELCLNAGEPDRAGELAGQVSEGTEGWERARNVLARLEFRQAAADVGSIADCETRCREHPDDLQAKVDLGLAQAAEGRFEEALETLLAVVQRDREFGAAHAKEPMVKIFNIVGSQSELANRYRAKLASALY